MKVAKGFTLVELSLSMVFIAILSIIIVLIINNAISSYHRGITLNQINTVGTDIVTDMRSVVQNSPASPLTDYCENYQEDLTVKEVCESDGARNYVSVEKVISVEDKTSGESEQVPIFGAFCTGSFSYIWNSGYYYSEETNKVGDNAEATFSYKIIEDGKEKDVTYENRIKLLKVKDNDRQVCISAIADSKKRYNIKYDLDSQFSSSEIVKEGEEPVELLAENSNMALYDLTTTIPAESKDTAFYTVSFILGTIQGGININTIGNACATPKGYNSGIANFDYCAINKFNFAAWAGGKNG